MSKFILLIIFLTMTNCYQEIFSQKQKNTESPTGSLYIIVQPGIKVYLDENLVGITNKEEDGLFIKIIDVGKHKLVLKHTSFQDKLFDIEISVGKTKELDLKSQIEGDLRDMNITKLRNIILSYGLYVFPLGIVEKNLLASDREGYFLLYFPNEDMNNKSNIEVKVGIVTVDEGDDISEYIKPSSPYIDTYAQLSYSDDRVYVNI